MTRYELEQLFKNQLAIMQHLAMGGVDLDHVKPLKKPIKDTQELLKLLDTQGAMGRQ